MPYIRDIDTPTTPAASTDPSKPSAYEAQGDDVSDVNARVDAEARMHNDYAHGCQAERPISDKYDDGETQSYERLRNPLCDKLPKTIPVDSDAKKAKTSGHDVTDENAVQLEEGAGEPGDEYVYDNIPDVIYENIPYHSSTQN